MRFIKKWSRALAPAKGSFPRGKEGARAYALGDIHGRLDLLELVLERIERDNAARSAKRTFVIFLGDFVDRGSDSAGVIERLRNYRPDFATPVFLAGNHEEVLQRLLSGERKVLSHWLRFGGAECAQSYGLDPGHLAKIKEEAALQLLAAKIPPEHRQFLEDLSDTFRFGDYLFVHAGIRPGVAIEEQSPSDLRWIRDPFLSDAKEHGMMVVHGHTVVDGVEERPNRIAIDTGAYRTGILTALGIEDDRRWYLTSAADDGGGIGPAGEGEQRAA